MILNNLFPTPVARFEFGREFTKQELKFVDKQEKFQNSGNFTSLDRYILKRKEIEDINTFCEKSLAEYLQVIHAPKQDIKLRITQSWLNYTKKGEYHHKHRHPNSLVSAVFYIQANKENDKIFFFNDRLPRLDITTENFNVYNSNSWWLEAHTGILYLFPSTLEHQVETVKEDMRISLSFNTIPVGYNGDEESLTALYL